MRYKTHRELIKELCRDIKYYFIIYLEYEDKDFKYLYNKLKHSFIIYLHKLKTERTIYKRNVIRKKS